MGYLPGGDLADFLGAEVLLVVSSRLLLGVALPPGRLAARSLQGAGPHARLWGKQPETRQLELPVKS